ncbi:ferredoxin [Sinorhizobium sp. Sb3]|uniref:2Fe-2S iron-sulfur cluster-binding protein n=1 Tax=Sinorhizobium sp. Sb3 TaxID=1358417 RepID=UPI000724E09F|nr:2Fe-2S iron-sulfur cluster-binding protein [Sinorhizobium sp. Sb3]KSV64558.1 ferredoxin [Sinorhizobium sp. Sb3]
MTMINPIVPNVSAEIARVSFSIFVYVADIDKSITAQEVRRFQVLLNDTNWIGNEDLRAGIAELKERYTSFWSNYEDGIFSTDIKSIAGALERVQRYIGDQRAKQLKAALGRFLVLLDRGFFGVKLGQKDNPQRAQAKNELATLLLDGNSPVLPVPVDNKTGVGAPTAGALPSPLPQPAPADTSVSPQVPLAPPPNVEVPPTPAARLAERELPGTSMIRAHKSPDQCKIWLGKTKLLCVSVTPETHDVKTYEFVGEPGTLFHYQPGQAITIEVPVQGKILRRTYTISSSPSRPYTLTITVKKVPMGWMSNWLFDNMRPGVECMASGPFGKFSCVNFPAEKLLFIAGGSGITPVMSMLRWIADLACNADVTFINNVNTPSDIIFQQELLHLSTRLGSRLSLSIIPAALSPGIPWHGATGRVDARLFQSHVPDLTEREVFVCGPPGYMEAVKSVLTSLGLPPDRYHEEAFGSSPQHSPANAPTPAPKSASVPAATLKPADAATSSVTTFHPPASLRSNGLQAPPSAPRKPEASPALGVAVPPRPAPPIVAEQPKAPANTAPTLATSTKPQVTIEGSGERFYVNSGQTILEAAEAAGIALEHSCRAGSCGSCKMRKVTGEVEMDADSCLSEHEISSGYVLTCVGRPVGAVVLAT